MVLVPRPSYPLFDFLAELESVRVERYPLAYDGEWHLATEAVARLITPRTRAIVVVNPNNPTGSFVKADEMAGPPRPVRRAGPRARSRTRCSPTTRRAPTHGESRASPRRAPGLAFSLGGLSKSCGLPQLKLDWIALSGPRTLREEAVARLEIVADTYLSVGTPVQQAAPTLLSRLPELQRPIAERVRDNRRFSPRPHGPGLPRHAPRRRRRLVRGAPGAGDDRRGGARLRLLEQRDVLVHPGFFFDFEREAFLVLSLLPAPDVFQQAVTRVLEDSVAAQPPGLRITIAVTSSSHGRPSPCAKAASKTRSTSSCADRPSFACTRDFKRSSPK